MFHSAGDARSRVGRSTLGRARFRLHAPQTLRIEHPTARERAALAFQTAPDLHQRMLDNDVQDRLQPQVCYSIGELHSLLPEIHPEDLIRAHQNGLIPRSLGEGIQLHFLGIDIVDYIESRNALRNPFL